jgi:hypothetical protein
MSKIDWSETATLPRVGLRNERISFGVRRLARAARGKIVF